jgi:hypothetical protein
MAYEEEKGKLFENFADPDENGYSDFIDVNNFEGKYEPLNVTNGSSWSSRRSYLYKKYFLIKEYEKGIVDTRKTDKKNSGIGMGKLLKIKLNGYKND